MATIENKTTHCLHYPHSQVYVEPGHEVAVQEEFLCWGNLPVFQPDLGICNAKFISTTKDGKVVLTAEPDKRRNALPDIHKVLPEV